LIADEGDAKIKLIEDEAFGSWKMCTKMNIFIQAKFLLKLHSSLHSRIVNVKHLIYFAVVD
jgi:hypothetical protein